MLASLLSLLLSVQPVHAGSGNIKVNVTGNPGEIVLDGFLTGKMAPNTIEDVAVGLHHVELHYGCMSGGSDVEVNPGQTTVVNMRMKTYQGMGTLRLRGLPNSGTVFVDGRPVNNPYEGFEAQCGGREVSVEAPGFEIWTTQVVVTRDKWATVDVEMVPGALDSTHSARRRPPPGVEIEDDLSDFEDDLADLDPEEDLFFDDDEEPPPLDLSTIDSIGGLDDEEYEEMDEESRAERNRRRLEEAEERERSGAKEWEPDNPSERELQRAQEYEEEQARKAAGLDDEYFHVEQGGGLGGSSLTGKLLVGGSTAALLTGATMALLGHQKYKANNATYGLVYGSKPEHCAMDATTLQVQCSPEAVSYYDTYVWPQQQKRAIGAILGGVGLLGAGAGYFMFDVSSGGGGSTAQKAAQRQAKADAKAEDRARKAAEKRAREEDAAEYRSEYGDLDEVVEPRARSGGASSSGLFVLAGTGALVVGGSTWGYLQHKKFEANELTYLTVWPECAVECTADGVAYYDAYVWPHQWKRITGFGIAGAGLVGMGIGMLATRPTQVLIAPTLGGLQIGISSRF